MPDTGELQKPLLACAVLIAVFCLLYLLLLGVRPLFIPDEVRYGEVAREMLARGDWIVPRLNGLLYFEKPPFGYWANAVSLAIFGENAFAVRIASALSVAASASVLFMLGRHFFRAPAVPYLAAFIFLTTFEVQAVGTYGVLDSIFAAALNGGIAVFAMSAARSARQRYLFLAVAGTLFGIAFLTKGFLAFALPFLILVPWSIINKHSAMLLRQAWVAVIFALIVIAPWAVAIHMRQADFWHYFIWVEHIQRFAADNAQHKEPFYFYLMYLPFVALPWIFLLPASISGLWNRDPMQDRHGAVSLLVLWAAVPLVFFSIANGKLLTYILPCFLPLSLVVASGLLESTISARFVRALIAAVGLATLTALLALLLTQYQMAGAPIFAATEQIKFLALAGSLTLAIAILVFGCVTRSRSGRAISSGLAAIPLLLALPSVLPETVMERKAPVAFLERVYAVARDGTAVVTNGSLVRAVSWALKRDDIYIVGRGAESAYGLNSADGRDRTLSADDFKQLLNRGAGVLLYCNRECEPEILRLLPAQTSTWSYGVFHAYFAPGLPASRCPPDTGTDSGIRVAC